MRLFRLAIPSLALLLALSQAFPGRAQEALPDRFAFADTTLLRDTLDLRFDHLFQLADSLRMTPDSLRAISIRYRFSPLRMVGLADSLRMPVDSVGPYLARERVSPLAAADAGWSNRFSYGSAYTFQETRTGWTNTGDYNLTWSQLFLNNLTTIQQERFLSGGKTTLRESRIANTEVGWRINREYSVGGRAVLGRFDSDDPSSINRVGDSRNEYQLSLRTRQRPLNGVTSEFNAFSGLLDFTSARQAKHGVTSDFNGRFRHTSGEWWLHEVTGQISSSLARTRALLTGSVENTRDVIGSLSGTVSLFEAATYSLGSTYGYQNSRVGQPDEVGVIQDVSSTTASADVTLRGQFTPNRMLSVSGNFSNSDQVTALSGPTSRKVRGVLTEGRDVLLGWSVEGRFKSTFSDGAIPQASETGGYSEDFTTHTLDGTLIRRLLPRLNARLNAFIGIQRYRYQVIGDYGTPPVSRDNVQQGYRVDGSYTLSDNFNTGVTLDVTRIQLVNLPSASTSANSTERLYRAEWRWTYRLMRGLTATQRNTVAATYRAFQFSGQNDRLILDYNTSTTLNAVLTPRVTIDVSHFSQVTPSGNYTPEADGLYYFRRADESRAQSLSTRVSYIPTPGLSLTLEPFYRSSERSANLNGASQPTRDDRNLSFQGNANLNLPVGARGQLSGSFGRTYFASRGIPYIAGIPQATPRSETDYWVGSLNLSWRL